MKFFANGDFPAYKVLYETLVVRRNGHMKVIKRVFVSIVISMILLGTVYKPVSVSADSDSVFGKSWFYNADDGAENGSSLYYTEHYSSTEAIAERIYDFYVWCYDYKYGEGVEGSIMRAFYKDKRKRFDVDKAYTFWDRYVQDLEVGDDMDDVCVGGIYIYPSVTGYETRDSVSPFIYYQGSSVSLKGKINKEFGMSVRKFMPFTPTVTDAFGDIWRAIKFVDRRINDIKGWLEEYIPVEMTIGVSHTDPRTYDKEAMIKAIAENLKQKGLNVLTAAYEALESDLSHDEYGADGRSIHYFLDKEAVKAGAVAITNAFNNNNYFFGRDEKYFDSKEDLGVFKYVGYFFIEEEDGKEFIDTHEISSFDQQWINEVMNNIDAIADDTVAMIDKVYKELPAMLAGATGANVFSYSVGEPGSIEQSLAEFVTSVGGQVSGLLAGNGITLNTIVYGRVITDSALPVLVNHYTFELQKKNPYGLVGSMIFSLLRVMLIMGVFIYAMIHLTRASFTVDPRMLAKLKGDAAYLLGAFALLFLVPNLLDGAMWVRDNILQAIANTFGNELSITGQALLDAIDTGRFVQAAEYLGMVLLGVYFAFSYISAACSMMIMFGMFPVFVLVGLADKKIIGEWFKFMIGIVMIPIIDACLLYVPHLAGKYGMATLAQIILCMAIIPTRGVVRQMLGFGHSAGAELVGIGAMMAAGRAIGGVARTAKNAVTGAVTGIGGAIADSRASKAYGELAKEDNRLMETAQTTQNEERTKVDVGVRQNEESSRDEVGANNSLGKAEFGVRDEKSDMDYYQGMASSETVDLGLPRQSMAFSASAGAGAGGFAFSAERTARQAVLAKAATLSNFDTQFKGALSNEQMAQMYKKRAAVGVARTVLKTAGTIAGGAYVGATGAAAGMMFGPTGMMMGAGMGASLGGEAGGALGDAVVTGFASSASWYDEKLSSREQAKAATKEQAEFLATDNNLGYVMYTGDADADIRALDNPDYVAAQETRWEACSTPEEQLKELRYQNSIINRASRNPFTGKGVLDEKQEKALLNSAFVNAYRTNLDAYRKEHTDAVVDFSNDPVSYGYYSQSNMKTWQDSMFSTDQQQAVRNLDDHTNSNRMGMLLLSAMRNDGEKSTAYQHAYSSAKRSVTYNSSFIPKRYSAFDSDASDAVEAGRVLSRFKEPDIAKINDNSSAGSQPDDGGGAGNTYVDTGHKDPNESNDKLDSKTSEIHDNHDGGDGDKPHRIV